MRAAFAAFLLLHGIAHLVGFLLPWGLIPVRHHPRRKTRRVQSGGHLLIGRAGEVWPQVAAFLETLPPMRAEKSAPPRVFATTR